jgi:hypothetical protein
VEALEWPTTACHSDDTICLWLGGLLLGKLLMVGLILGELLLGGLLLSELLLHELLLGELPLDKRLLGELLSFRRGEHRKVHTSYGNVVFRRQCANVLTITASGGDNVFSSFLTG